MWRGGRELGAVVFGHCRTLDREPIDGRRVVAAAFDRSRRVPLRPSGSSATSPCCAAVAGRPGSPTSCPAPLSNTTASSTPGSSGSPSCRTRRRSPTPRRPTAARGRSTTARPTRTSVWAVRAGPDPGRCPRPGRRRRGSCTAGASRTQARPDVRVLAGDGAWPGRSVDGAADPRAAGRGPLGRQRRSRSRRSWRRRRDSSCTTRARRVGHRRRRGSGSLARRTAWPGRGVSPPGADAGGGPVFEPGQCAGLGRRSTTMPNVTLLPDGRRLMLTTGFEGNEAAVGAATSTDGISGSVPGASPVLEQTDVPGSQGLHTVELFERSSGPTLLDRIARRGHVGRLARGARPALIAAGSGRRPGEPGAARYAGRTMPIERVFVAGAGLMGHGIAQVHAAIGRAVVLYEPDLARAEAGRERIAGNLDRSVAKGRLTQHERDATIARLQSTADLARRRRRRPRHRGGVRGRRGQVGAVARARRDRPGRTRSSPRTPRRSRSTAWPRRSHASDASASPGCTSSAPCRSCR